MDKANSTSPGINCGCVIHGSAYDWTYVERLHSMLSRHLTNFGQLHVWTEADRPMPDHMVKHVLEPMNTPLGWWYKMQLFNRQHYSGNLLYFDLDVIIVNSINWIAELDPQQFWAVNDFLYLQSGDGYHSINSSVMWYNTEKMSWLWDKFKPIHMAQHRGDQDYLEHEIHHRQYFDTQKVLSWRWQAQNAPLNSLASILVFHGQPKPHDLLDNVVVKQHWR
jgi:hypothetical protein